MTKELKPGLADNYWNREIQKVEDFRNNMFNNIEPCVMKYGIYEPVYHPKNLLPLPPKDVYQIPLKKIALITKPIVHYLN